jgi:nicotinate-nucleotide pyrophosphorylase (carboxylating)
LTAPVLPRDLDETIRHALAEDLGPEGDITSKAIIAPDALCSARVETRDDGVIAGLPAAQRVFGIVDAETSFEPKLTDGDVVRGGDTVATVHGTARSVLAAERVALNFLTHLSGIATLTRRYVEACTGTDSVILCTRKTLPGVRALQRYAVAVGGGRLHRFGLSDGVLIKDNHVALAGGVQKALARAKETAPHTVRVEVEVETIEQLEQALEAGANAVLLDNPDVETVKRAIELVGERVPLEVSGGMTVERVRQIAPLGRLLISVGRLTHSAPALDIALEIETA